MTEQSDVLGPIGYLVVEFPKVKVTGKGMELLLDLVDRGIIRILDLALVMKSDDGTVRAMELNDVDADGEFDMTVFEGVSSGLLDADDVAEGGAILDAGSAAAILLYENRWAAPFTAALRDAGGQLVAAGFVPQDAIVASLDAMELAAN